MSEPLNRAIGYAAQSAGIATAGLMDVWERAEPPLYSRWTLTWWIGTMIITLAGAAILCLGSAWGSLPIALAFASCYSDARFGLWED